MKCPFGSHACRNVNVIKAAIAKHGKLCKAKWSDAKIVETICKFDVEYAALHFEPGAVG